MTIDILFMTDKQLVLRINMSFSNFENKILDGLSDTEKEVDDKMFTNIEFIGKVWYVCVSYGYMFEDYNAIGKFLDQLKVSL